MKTFPNFELKRIRLSKKHTVLTFRRNNLNYEEFFYEDGKFVFEEKFEIGQNRGTFRMSVKCKRFDDIFNHGSEEIEIRGSKTHFGILLTLPDYAKPPVSEFGENEYVQYWLFFHGGKLELEDRYALAREKRKAETAKKIEERKQRKPDVSLKLTRINASCDVLVFSRNNLCFDDFLFDGEVYTYNEIIWVNGSAVRLKICVKDKSLNEIFMCNNSSFNAVGSGRHFDAHIRIVGKQRFPIHNHGRNGCVEYWLECDKGCLAVETTRSNPAPSLLDTSGHNRRYYSSQDIYEITEWSIKHPYVGGRFSPK